ncbi:hypothetical protein M407DRAFT_29635 [Tulasnella calospora MUT 4182]|uniref:Uncharacterized protein n=1 Tax=Tulasnella calospora MUT 4182 TaxID=1051891 RepID=A0A0C3Q8P0_9AGAM|nr:hypothetical protein M407DRAFT_29635 [Tulasnella calospora MUT 4182]
MLTTTPQSRSPSPPEQQGSLSPPPPPPLRVPPLPLETKPKVRSSSFLIRNEFEFLNYPPDQQHQFYESGGTLIRPPVPDPGPEWPHHYNPAVPPPPATTAPQIGRQSNILPSPAVARAKDLRERSTGSRRRGERRAAVRRSRGYRFGVERGQGGRSRRPRALRERGRVEDDVPPILADGVPPDSLIGSFDLGMAVQHRAREEQDRHPRRNDLHHHHRRRRSYYGGIRRAGELESSWTQEACFDGHVRAGDVRCGGGEIRCCGGVQFACAVGAGSVIRAAHWRLGRRCGKEEEAQFRKLTVALSPHPHQPPPHHPHLHQLGSSASHASTHSRSSLGGLSETNPQSDAASSSIASANALVIQNALKLLAGGAESAPAPVPPPPVAVPPQQPAP